MLLLENNLTNAAASFVSPPGEATHAKDFTLRRDSPAWKMGFQPIPLDKIGLYRDDFRAGPCEP
jgi:hypothetical protein